MFIKFFITKRFVIMEEIVDDESGSSRPVITCVERTRKLSILLRRHKEPVIKP